MSGAALPLLLVSSLFIAGASAVSAGQGPGEAEQPNPTTTPTAADPQAELKALINSPEARSVAVFRCSSAQEAGPEACPLAAGVDELTKSFDNTLLTGTGSETALVTTLKTLLNASYGGDKVWPDSVDYAIVHLVKPAGDSMRGRWLLFSRGKGKAVSTATASTGTRIMGSKRVAVVFVHLNVSVSFDPNGTPPQPRTAAEAASTLYSDVEYRAIAQPKVPINVQRLLGLLKLAATAEAQAGKKEEKLVSMLGFGVYTDMPVPSDLTVFGAHIQETPVGFGTPITYDNEGKYFWDVSVAAPVNKITLLEYDETDGTFTPKSLNKQSIYGAINIYPWPVDIKAGKLRWIVPRALIGIGLTGRPGENFLLAGAFGIKEFQIFVGSAFANQRVLTPGADPANGASYTQRYASRLTFGINVPVAAAAKTLAGGGK